MRHTPNRAKTSRAMRRSVMSGVRVIPEAEPSRRTKVYMDSISEKECVFRSLSWMTVSNVVVNECADVKSNRVTYVLEELHQ